MSIVVAMFVKLFISQWFVLKVCISKGFFAAFEHRKIAKAKKLAFSNLNATARKFLIFLRRVTALYNLGIVAI